MPLCSVRGRERETERDAPIPRLVALNQPRKRRSMRSSGDLGGVGEGRGRGMRANNLAGQRRVGLRKSVVFPKSRLPSLRSPVVWLWDPGSGGTVLEKVRLGVGTMEVDVIYVTYIESGERVEIEMCE